MTLTMKSSGGKCFGKANVRQRARPNPFYVPAAPRSNTSEICDAEELEEVEEAAEAAPESRPAFIPPAEDVLRVLARDVVKELRADYESVEDLLIFAAYARICSPGLPSAAVENFVLAELRRHLSVIKAKPDRPEAEKIPEALAAHGKILPGLIKARLEIAVKEPSNGQRLQSGHWAYPITISSRRCHILVKRNGQTQVIGLLTEKELKDMRLKEAKSRKDTFHRHAPASTR
ncbi:MAG: hypothetical protein WCW31_02225 [Patescibacteria group bacterium]|jgi:hypothetical protein